MPPQSTQQKNPRKPAPDPPPPKPEPKLSSGAWFLLFLAALFIDLAQIGAEIIVIGVALNPIIDIIVGLSLFLLFFMKHMLDWRLTASLLVGFGVDAGTDGIFPAWTFDIAYAWFITDGSRQLGKIPLIGKTAQKAVQTAVQRKMPVHGNALGGNQVGTPPPRATPPLPGKQSSPLPEQRPQPLPGQAPPKTGGSWEDSERERRTKMKKDVQDRLEVKSRLNRMREAQARGEDITQQSFD